MSNTSRNKLRAGELPREGSSAKPPSALDAHLGYWLRAVSNHVSHAFKLKVEQHGVTVAEWVVLRALFETHEVKPSELANTLGLTRGAVSKLVDRLLAKQLLSIRRDEQDGRAQFVSLRAGGRRLVPKLAELADENDAETFGRLDPKQQALLWKALKGLAEQLGLRGAPVD
jgi:DNA-binding MarR family transcriptional regulator